MSFDGTTKTPTPRKGFLEPFWIWKYGHLPRGGLLCFYSILEGTYTDTTHFGGRGTPYEPGGLGNPGSGAQIETSEYVRNLLRCPVEFPAGFFDFEKLFRFEKGRCQRQDAILAGLLLGEPRQVWRELFEPKYSSSAYSGWTKFISHLRNPGF